MIGNIHQGSFVLCVDRPPKGRLTIGKVYKVIFDNRGDGEYPSVVNDDGRLTQYHHRWFSLAEDTA